MSKQDGSRRQTSDPTSDDGTATILHIDMDAFFASVELLEHPELHGKPVIIAHDLPRSVVTTATYAARRYGVGSAMPVARAKQLCPQLIILEPHMEKYREYSRKAMGIFARFTPLVEPLSIDEAFLDVSGARRLHGMPGQIATKIRELVCSELGLTCTVGVAASKSVAKIASTLAKPDGLLIVPAAHTHQFLAPLSVSTLWGVGKVTATNLKNAGINTVAQLTQSDPAFVQRVVGKAAAVKILHLAEGEDDRAVVTQRVEKSVSQERTYAQDVTDRAQVRRTILALADAVARRLRTAGISAGGIGIKLRDAEFATLQRSQKLATPTNVSKELAEIAAQLLDDAWDGLDGRAIRLVGVRAERLGDGAQTLWDSFAQWRTTDEVRDKLSARFGAEAVLPASLMHRQDKLDDVE